MKYWKQFSLCWKIIVQIDVWSKCVLKDEQGRGYWPVACNFLGYQMQKRSPQGTCGVPFIILRRRSVYNDFIPYHPMNVVKVLMPHHTFERKSPKSQNNFGSGSGGSPCGVGLYWIIFLERYLLPWKRERLERLPSWVIRTCLCICYKYEKDALCNLEKQLIVSLT